MTTQREENVRKVAATVGVPVTQVWMMVQRANLTGRPQFAASPNGWMFRITGDGMAEIKIGVYAELDDFEVENA